MTDTPMTMPDMGEYLQIAFECFENGHFWRVWNTRPSLCSACFTDDRYLDWEDEHPAIAAKAFDDYRLDDLWRGNYLTVEGSQDEIHNALFFLAMVNGGVFSATAVSPLGCLAVAFCRLTPHLKGVTSLEKAEILEVVWYDFTGVPTERSVRLFDGNGCPVYAALPVNPRPHGASNG